MHSHISLPLSPSTFCFLSIVGKALACDSSFTYQCFHNQHIWGTAHRNNNILKPASKCSTHTHPQTWFRALFNHRLYIPLQPMIQWLIGFYFCWGCQGQTKLYSHACVYSLITVILAYILYCCRDDHALKLKTSVFLSITIILHNREWLTTKQ